MTFIVSKAVVRFLNLCTRFSYRQELVSPKVIVHETLQLVYFNSVCSQFDIIPTCKEIKSANNLSALGALKVNSFCEQNNNNQSSTKGTCMAWSGK